MIKIITDDYTSLLERYGFNDEDSELINTLLYELKERDNLLRERGIIEDVDGGIKISEVVNDDYKRRYEELKAKYYSRFNGDTTTIVGDVTGGDTVYDENTESEKEQYRYEDLFIGKEED